MYWLCRQSLIATTNKNGQNIKDNIVFNISIIPIVQNYFLFDLFYHIHLKSMIVIVTNMFIYFKILLKPKILIKIH